MADLIDRQALLDTLKTEKGSDILGHSTLRFLKLKGMIDAVSIVDAEEVVRCKDCAVPHNVWTGCPKLNGLVTPPDFYCGFGERVNTHE